MKYLRGVMCLLLVILKGHAVDCSYLCLYAEDNKGDLHVLLGTKNDKGYWFDERYIDNKKGPARFITNQEEKRSIVFYHEGSPITNSPSQLVLPGGRVKDNEEGHIASLREFAEETGVSLDLVQLGARHTYKTFKATESRKTQDKGYGVLYVKLPTLEALKEREKGINGILLRGCGAYKGKLKNINEDAFDKRHTSDKDFLGLLGNQFPPTDSNELRRVEVYPIDDAIKLIQQQKTTYWFQNILEHLDNQLDDQDD